MTYMTVDEGRALLKLITVHFPELLIDEPLNGDDAINRLNELLDETLSKFGLTRKEISKNA